MALGSTGYVQVPLSFSQVPVPSTGLSTVGSLLNYDPDSINSQKLAYKTSLADQVRQGEELLRAQQKQQQEYLKQAADAQKQQLIAQVDLIARQQEAALSEKYSKQQLALQQEYINHQIHLEQQARTLSQECLKAKELQQQQLQLQQLLQQELQREQLQQQQQHAAVAAAATAAAMRTQEELRLQQQQQQMQQAAMAQAAMTQTYLSQQAMVQQPLTQHMNEIRRLQKALQINQQQQQQLALQSALPGQVPTTSTLSSLSSVSAPPGPVPRYLPSGELNPAALVGSPAATAPAPVPSQMALQSGFPVQPPYMLSAPLAAAAPTAPAVTSPSMPTAAAVPTISYCMTAPQFQSSTGAPFEGTGPISVAKTIDPYLAPSSYSVAPTRVVEVPVYLSPSDTPRLTELVPQPQITPRPGTLEAVVEDTTSIVAEVLSETVYSSPPSVAGSEIREVPDGSSFKDRLQATTLFSEGVEEEEEEEEDEEVGPRPSILDATVPVKSPKSETASTANSAPTNVFAANRVPSSGYSAGSPSNYGGPARFSPANSMTGGGGSPTSEAAAPAAATATATTSAGATSTATSSSPLPPRTIPSPALPQLSATSEIPRSALNATVEVPMRMPFRVAAEQTSCI